ncbi:ead/Ea22-like family protein [Enterobacter roggenkampii]
MSNIDKQALRQHAEHIIELEGDEAICHRVLIDAYEKSDQLFTAQNVLALLDELEAKETENERMARELLNRSGEIEGLRQRIAELESREINMPPYSFFDFKQGSPFKCGAYCHIDSLNTELSKHGIKITAAACKGGAS